MARWLAWVLVLAGCSGPEKMAGFTEREAASLPVAPAGVEACGLRKGRVVLEVEHALVREYPKTRRDLLDEKKQPLLLLWVSRPVAGPGAVALTPLPAPEEYRAGEPVRLFEGKRLLDQPARLLRGRRLDLRLAENNRTIEPEWRKLAGQIGHGMGSAAGELGAPAPPQGLVDTALDLLNRLDKDDLILRWSVEADEVMAALGEPSQRKALRFHLATSRSAPMTPPAPSAEIDVLFYWEPEPGCEWLVPAAPAAPAARPATSG